MLKSHASTSEMCLVKKKKKKYMISLIKRSFIKFLLKFNLEKNIRSKNTVLFYKIKNKATPKTN